MEWLFMAGYKHFVSTFFVFNDYFRPSIRLAALQKLPVIYVFTHDSIAVGEDGPTHEPIEQLELFGQFRVLPLSGHLMQMRQQMLGHMLYSKNGWSSWFSA